MAAGLATTSERVLAWRMRRQFLAEREATSAVAVARRLAGVQAQVPASAEQAVAVRRADRRSGVPDALADRSLVRTWAMRGTLHLLDAATAPAVLGLLASARSWEKGAWQKEFAPAATMAALAEAADHVLDGAVLSRDELVAALADAAGGAYGHLGSGWGVLLKPLAWQGLLCNGPPDGTRPTFTHPRSWVPGWPGLPDVDAAARVVVPAYLGAHGPATPETFDAWLLRGATPRKRLRGWFADLVEAGVLAPVEVDGETRYACAEHLDALSDAADTAPVTGLRLLPGFDHYVLGPGTADPQVVPHEHRGRVSRAAGWIAPVVVERGRVVGTWTVPSPADDHLAIEPFDGAPEPADIDAERAVWSEILGRPLRG